MNHARIDTSHIIRFIRNSGLLLLSLFACFLPVQAQLIVAPYENTFGDNVSDLLAYFGLGEASSIRGIVYNGYYYRYRVVSRSSSGTPTLSEGNSLNIPVCAVYCETNSVVFFYDAGTYNSGRVYVCLDQSSDGLVWTQYTWTEVPSAYQYSDVGVTGTLIKFAYFGSNTSGFNTYGRNSISRSDTGLIPYIDASWSSVAAVISGNSSYRPWNGTTSSGGRHWSDGTSLDGENTSKYSQIFVIMDSNNDNSVTQEEVNYYNYTYNTDYDYSSVNQSQNFDQDEFLYWVAKQIEVGVENPGGGTGSGGSSSGNGITVTDSFTQTQTQTIEENAVNVTVNNNNSLTQENYQELNSLINNYNGSSEDETDPFQQAIGNFQAFHAIALAFAGLASVVFGWLPWWVTALLGAMFSMVCVFIVLRLIHLFK